MKYLIFCAITIVLSIFSGFVNGKDFGTNRKYTKDVSDGMLLSKGTEGGEYPEYTVDVGDTLNISILQPEKMLVTVTILSDGAISFPYIGKVLVKGMNLNEIQQEIETKLKDGYMKYPMVSVSIVDTYSKKFFVYGEVKMPNAYPFQEGITALKAISLAGGFTRFASLNQVKVLRANHQKGKYDTIKVDIKAIIRNKGGKDIILEPGDIVVVPEGIL